MIMAKYRDYQREPQGPTLHSHHGIVHDHPYGDQPHSHGEQNKHRLRNTMLVLGGLVVLIIIIAVVVSSRGGTHRASTAAGPGTAPTATATTQPSRATTGSQPASNAPSGVGSPQVIARLNGSGDQNTSPFTVPDTWHLSWAYWGCPAGQANFQVSQYNTDGSPDSNGVDVNELGSGRGPVATTAYGDGGSHYFQVSTEGCSWSLVVLTGQG